MLDPARRRLLAMCVAVFVPLGVSAGLAVAATGDVARNDPRLHVLLAPERDSVVRYLWAYNRARPSNLARRVQLKQRLATQQAAVRAAAKADGWRWGVRARGKRFRILRDVRVKRLVPTFTPAMFSQSAVDLIVRFEGFFSCPYLDPVGIPTRGYGETHGVTLRSPCVTKAQALQGLRERLKEHYWPPVQRIGGLNQARADALTSAVYNLGPGILSTATGIGRALAARAWRQAAQELRKWVHAGGRVLPGLVRRREAEITLFCSQGGC